METTGEDEYFSCWDSVRDWINITMSFKDEGSSCRSCCPESMLGKDP